MAGTVPEDVRGVNFANEYVRRSKTTSMNTSPLLMSFFVAAQQILAGEASNASDLVAPLGDLIFPVGILIALVVLLIALVMQYVIP